MLIFSRNILLLSLLLWSTLTPGQTLPKPYSEAETNTYFSSGKMLPFWFQSNQWGKYSPASTGNVTSLTLLSQPGKDSRNSHVLSLNYGLEVSSRYTPGEAQLWLHQGYLKADYQNIFRLTGGVWEETMGNQYAPLSSGGIIWSGNARPLPKIQIGTTDYIKAPFTNGKLEGKALLAHGWFNGDRYVKNVWLHHKFVGIRTSWDFPISIHLGFHHFAQWGGENDKYGQLPDDLEDFWKIFAVKKGGEESRRSDQMNKAGNHLGSRYIGIDWKQKPSKIGFYYQDIFEDGSGMRKQNFPDGLWGIYYETNHSLRLIKGVLYEWLYTDHQSGPLHSLELELAGNDNYFNHGGYSSGWSAYRRSIGTPFITSPILNNPLFTPDKTTDHDHKFSNNRVNVHHIGIMGNFSEKTEYKILGSFSTNKGLHDYDGNNWRPDFYRILSPRNQWSFRADLKHLWQKLNLETSLSLAADIGEMYGNNFGMMLGLKVPLYFTGEKVE